MPSVHSVNKV
uniref:Uncharacterized protein n=1 Tax=Arundo donax TaxID=35708 RepID=A0A0A9FJ11_ARUDO